MLEFIVPMLGIDDIIPPACGITGCDTVIEKLRAELPLSITAGLSRAL